MLLFCLGNSFREDEEVIVSDLLKRVGLGIFKSSGTDRVLYQWKQPCSRIYQQQDGKSGGLSGQSSPAAQKGSCLIGLVQPRNSEVIMVIRL